MSILRATPLAKLATSWRSLSQRCANADCDITALQRTVSLKGNGVHVGDQWYCGPVCFQLEAEQRFTRILDSRKRPIARRSPRMPLELVMVSRGMITEEQLKTAYASKHSEDGIIRTLQNLGYVNAGQVLSATAAQWGFPVFPLKSAGPSVDISFPSHLIEKYRFLPVHLSAITGKLLLGFVNGVDHGLVRVIETITGHAVAPCFIAADEYERYRPYFATNQSEVVFESPASAKEMASILRNYGQQVEADEASFAHCRDFAWIRLKHNSEPFDVIFQFA
jgi:hypothetical protein